MRATGFSLGALLALSVTASPGFSQQYYTSAYHHPIRPAPDACWGGFYTVGPDGTAYGPNYNLRPPFAPYQGPGFPGMGAGRGGGGFGPPAGGPGGPGQVVPEFRYNPYVRGPRDFFMWGDMMEQQRALERRPVLVP
jgi:hypothetical protein